MVTTRSTALVPASPERVWSVLAAFADISRWAPNVAQSSLLTDGPAGVGTVRRVQVGRSALRETVMVWEPERRLVYRISGLPAVVHEATNTWRLDPHPDGTTVTLTGDAVTRGPGVVGRIVGRLIGRENDALVHGLAHHPDLRAKERP